MSLNLLNSRNSIIFAVWVIFLFTGIAVCSDVNKTAGKSTAESNEPNGPTVTLNYSSRTYKENSFDSFMYFVPLISPDTVDVKISAGNEQKVSTVSYERKVYSKSFYVNCEFKMFGKGFHKYIFDANEIIARYSGELKAGETMDRIIDYIKFEGEGIGAIEVKGTIKESVKTVTGVVLHFNAGDLQSPVTLGFYDIKPKDGQYKYENRSNELIARVDSFIFKKSNGEPEMGIKLSSVKEPAKPEGFLADMTGVIANFFIEPQNISKLGNDTMLNFGLALLDEKPSFTFPKAENIRKNNVVTADEQ
jgi:hypothetical protein